MKTTTSKKQVQNPHCLLHTVTFAAVAATVAEFFLRGCVASPFLRSKGMMSVFLDRLMILRQTGHCERFGSPGAARFSPAMRASIRQV